MQLSMEECENIAVLRGQGLFLRDISLRIGRHHSTISREINRKRDLER